MGFIIKNTAGLVNTRLTDIGREKLSQGNFNISYFQVGDSEVSYNTLPTSYNQFDTVILEPSFNAQNSSGIPQSNKSNVKYPYYVDGSAGNTYGIPFMDSQISPVFNRAVMRGFFTGNTSADTISWSALTNNFYAINANYVVQMNSLVGTNKITLINNSSNSDSVREPAIGDIITIYYDGKGMEDSSCTYYTTPTPTPTPTSTFNPKPPPLECNCVTFPGDGFSENTCTFEYLDCQGVIASETYFLSAGTSVCSSDPNNINSACKFASPIIGGTCTGLAKDECLILAGPNPPPTSTPTPTSSNSFPCESPTPTPTPSKTPCLTPSTSRECPLPPPPDCLVDISSCYAMLTYKIVNICLGEITLDRPTPNFINVTNVCYGRVIVYPPNMTTIYDSITPSRHWNDNVINFESVCYTDEFDVKIWNMNIPWSENPAGLISSISKDYTNFGSIAYLGTKEYFGYASSSGQTDSSSTYYFNSFGDKINVNPEQQKAIGIIHYTNQTVDFFYGEKFALEPFDTSNPADTTGEARNFKVHIPWLMWHKNPDCCNGQTFWVDPPGFEDLNLFQVQYLQSTKNVDMNNPGMRYYHLWDTNANANGIPNRVGKVFPDDKLVIIDDEEIIAAMSYKSNRNWTLPSPKISLITPNTCGNDSSTVTGILTGLTESLYVTYRLSNTDLFTDSLHCNYYSFIQGPNIDCSPITSQNVAVRFGGEFGCLNQPFYPITTTTTSFYPTTTTTTSFYPTTTTTTTVLPCFDITLLDTIGVGGSPIRAVYVPTNQRLYVNNFDSDTVSVIDTNTNTVDTTITVGVKPSSIQYSPNSNINGAIYVVNSGDDTVSVIDVFSNTVTATISTGNAPNDSNFIESLNKLYIVNGISTDLTVIDTGTNTVLGTVLLTDIPNNITYDPIHGYLYVSIDGLNLVEVIDTVTDTSITTIPVGVNPTNIVYSPINHFVYVINYIDATVSKIDTNSNSVVSTITVGNSAISITETPSYIYVTNTSDNTITAIDINTDARTTILSNQPYNLTYNPSNGYVYVNKQDVNIDIIDTTTNSVVQSINVGFYSSFGNYVPKPNKDNVYVNSIDKPNNSFMFELGCSQITTTTTTYNPVTTTTTYNPVTTTTTSICPIYCDVIQGFLANKFEILCQKVVGNARPNSSEWVAIDFTSQLTSTMVNGYITQEGLTGNTFVITQQEYDDAPTYNLNTYIPLTPVGYTGTSLNFGDEYYFYGSLETDIQATIYEMKYKINLGQAEFQTTSNPTWTSGKPSFVSEIGLYDNEKNLMIISKTQSPVLRQGIQQFLIKFDI